MKKYRYTLAIFILLVLSFPLNSRFLMASSADNMVTNAMQRTIKGKVTGSDGEVLPGVYIMIKGTTTGTMTDVNGNYSLSIPDNNVTLQFSYVGYISEVVEITNQSIVDVILIQSIESLEEIVIVAYGKVKNRI